MEKAIREVASGRMERVNVPGQWTVWCDETGVRVKVL